ARLRVDVVPDGAAGGFGAAPAVLGAEQGGQREAAALLRVDEQVDRAAQLPVGAGGVGDEADALAVEEGECVGGEEVLDAEAEGALLRPALALPLVVRRGLGGAGGEGGASGQGAEGGEDAAAGRPSSGPLPRPARRGGRIVLGRVHRWASVIVVGSRAGKQRGRRGHDPARYRPVAPVTTCQVVDRRQAGSDQRSFRPST